MSQLSIRLETLLITTLTSVYTSGTPAVHGAFTRFGVNQTSSSGERKGGGTNPGPRLTALSCWLTCWLTL